MRSVDILANGNNMTQMNFEVRADIYNKIIYIIMRGFWSLDDVSAYFDQKNDAIQKMKNSGIAQDHIKIMIDLSDWSTQTKAVADLIDKNSSLAVKTAVVLQKSMLSNRQSRRIASEGYQFFENKADAMAWLNQ